MLKRLFCGAFVGIALLGSASVIASPLPEEAGAAAVAAMVGYEPLPSPAFRVIEEGVETALIGAEAAGRAM